MAGFLDNIIKDAGGIQALNPVTALPVKLPNSTGFADEKGSLPDAENIPMDQGEFDSYKNRQIMPNVTDIQNSQEQRFQEQKIKDTAANAIAKFVGKTAIIVGDTVGGLALAVPSIFSSGEFNSFYTNDFHRMMDKASQSMDNIMPIYESTKYNDLGWGKLTTAKFWGDDVLGAGSFTAGAILSEMALTTLSAVTLGAAEPAQIAETASIVSKVKKMFSLLGKEGFLAATKDFGITALKSSVVGAGYEAGVEARNTLQNARQNYLNNYRNTYGHDPSSQEMGQAEEHFKNVANTVFAANSVLLSLDNIIEFKNIFGKGVGAQIAAYGKEGAEKYLEKDGVRTTINALEGELAPAYKSASRVQKIASTTARMLKNPIVEGNEEGAQNLFQNIATDYINSKYNPQSHIDNFNIYQSTVDNFKKSYGSEDAGVGFLIGALGMPGLGIMMGNTKNVQGLANKLAFSFEGGSAEAFQENYNNKKAADEAVASAGKVSIKNIEQEFHNSATQYTSNDAKSKAVQEGKMFDGKNAENMGLFSFLKTRDNLGLLPEVTEQYKERVQNMSEDEFKNTFGYDDMVNEQELAKRKDEVLKSFNQKVDNYKKAGEIANRVAPVNNFLDENSRFHNEAIHYLIASNYDVDNREEKVAKDIKDTLQESGTVSAQRLANLTDFHDKFHKLTRERYKEKLDKYSEKLAQLRKAHAKSSDVKGDYTTLQEEVDNYEKGFQKEISNLTDKNSKLQESGYDLNYNFKDINNFRQAVEEHSQLQEDIKNHIKDNPFDKKGLEDKLHDLKQLQERRHEIINTYNDIYSKQGRDKLTASRVRAKRQSQLIQMVMMMPHNIKEGSESKSDTNKNLDDLESTHELIKNTALDDTTHSIVKEEAEKVDQIIDKVNRFRNEPISHENLAELKRQIENLKEIQRRLEDFIKDGKENKSLTQDNISKAELFADESVGNYITEYNKLAKEMQEKLKNDKEAEKVEAVKPFYDDIRAMFRVWNVNSPEQREHLQNVLADLQKQFGDNISTKESEFRNRLLFQLQELTEEEKKESENKQASIKIQRGFSVGDKRFNVKVLLDGKEVGGLIHSSQHSFKNSEGIYEPLDLEKLKSDEEYQKNVIEKLNYHKSYDKEDIKQVADYMVAMSNMMDNLLEKLVVAPKFESKYVDLKDVLDQNKFISQITLDFRDNRDKNNDLVETSIEDQLNDSTSIIRRVGVQKITYLDGLSNVEKNIIIVARKGVKTRDIKDFYIAEVDDKENPIKNDFGKIEWTSLFSTENGMFLKNPNLYSHIKSLLNVDNKTYQQDSVFGLVMFEADSTPKILNTSNKTISNISEKSLESKGVQKQLLPVFNKVKEKMFQFFEENKDRNSEERQHKGKLISDDTFITAEKQANKYGLEIKMLLGDDGELIYQIKDNLSEGNQKRKYYVNTGILFNGENYYKVYGDRRLTEEEKKMPYKEAINSIISRLKGRAIAKDSVGEFLDTINKQHDYTDKEKGYRFSITDKIQQMTGEKIAVTGFYENIELHNQFQENLEKLVTTKTVNQSMYVVPKGGNFEDIFNFEQVQQEKKESRRKEELEKELFGEKQVVVAKQNEQKIESKSSSSTTEELISPLASSEVMSMMGFTDEEVNYDTIDINILKQALDIVKPEFKEQNLDDANIRQIFKWGFGSNDLKEKLLNTVQQIQEKQTKAESTSNIEERRQEIREIFKTNKLLAVYIINNEKKVGSYDSYGRSNGEIQDIVAVLKIPVSEAQKLLQEYLDSGKTKDWKLGDDYNFSKYNIGLTSLEEKKNTVNLDKLTSLGISESNVLINADIIQKGNSSDLDFLRDNEFDDIQANFTDFEDYQNTILNAAKELKDSTKTGANKLLRIAGDREIIDFNTAIANLAKILPIKTLDNPNGIIEVKDVINILQNLKVKGELAGRFMNKAIYLNSNGVVKGVEYHEAFHAVFRMLLSDGEIAKYYRAAQEKYGSPLKQELDSLKTSSSDLANLNDFQLKLLWLEEKMADGFQDYVKSFQNNEEVKVKEGWLRRLFNRIKNFIFGISENKDEIQKLFSSIYSGQYKDSEERFALTRGVNNGNIANKLLKKHVVYTDLQGNKEIKKGFLSHNISEAVINTVTNNIHENLLRQGRTNILDKEIVKEAKAIAERFNVNLDVNQKLLSTLPEGQRAMKTKQMNEVYESLLNTDNLITVKDEVLERIKLYNLSNELTIEEKLIKQLRTEEGQLDDEADTDEIEDQDGDGDNGMVKKKTNEINYAWEKASKRVKQYISSVSVKSDLLNIGKRFFDFLDTTDKESQFNFAVKGSYVYSNLVKMLANTPEYKTLNMLNSLKTVSPEIEAFLNKWSKDIYRDLKSKDITLPEVIGNDYYKAIEKLSYKELSKSEHFSFITADLSKSRIFLQDLIVDEQGMAKMVNANNRDTALQLFNRWEKAWQSKGINTSEEYVNTFERFKTNLKLGSDTIFMDYYRTLSDNNISSEEKGKAISKYINTIKDSFESIGITLPDIYIKYSLLDFVKSIDKDGTLLTTEEKNWLKAFSASSIEPITPSFLKDRILNAYNISLIANIKSIYSEINEENIKQSTLGAIGAIKDIAESVAIFDPSVIPSSFNNQEGKRIYDIVPSSDISKRTNSLKDKENIQLLKDYLENSKKENNLETAKRDFIDRVLNIISENNPVIENPHYFHGWFTNEKQVRNFLQVIDNNPLFDLVDNIDKNAYLDSLFSNLELSYAGGIRQDELKLVKDENIEGDEGNIERGYGLFTDSDGKSYSNADETAKILYQLTLLSQSEHTQGNIKKDKITEGKEVKEINYAYYKTLQPAEKSTVPITRLPIIETVKNGKINSKAKDLLFKLFSQEFYRIRDILSQNDEFTNSEYNKKSGYSEDYNYVEGSVLGVGEVKVFINSKGEFYYLDINDNNNPIRLSSEQMKEIDESKDGRNAFIPRGLKFMNFAKADLSEFEDKAKDLSYELTKEDKNIINSKIEEFINKQFNEWIDFLAKDNIQIIKRKNASEIVEGNTEPYKNNLLPLGFQTKDGIDRSALKNAFLNDYIMSSGFNMLLYGDNANAAKNATDWVKRAGGVIGAGPNAGEGKSNIILVKSQERFANLEGQPSTKTDITDAQSFANVFWHMITVLKSKGALDKRTQNIYQALDNGLGIKGINLETNKFEYITEDDLQYLYDNLAQHQPNKTQGYSFENYWKTSVAILLRREVSKLIDESAQIKRRIFDLHEKLFNNKLNNTDLFSKENERTRQYHEYLNDLYSFQAYFKPAPGFRIRHNLLNQMEWTNSVVVFDSAWKRNKMDIHEIDHKGNMYLYKDRSGDETIIPNELSNSAIIEQQKTDGVKNESIDGTQKIRLITTEQDRETVSSFGKKNISIGTLVDTYDNLLDKRVAIGFDSLKQKTLNEDDTIKWKSMLSSFQESIQGSSADPQLLEMFQAAENAKKDKPKYNLNNPAVETKFQAMFLAYVSKNVLKHKAAGSKFTLMSDYGYELVREINDVGEIVRTLTSKQSRKSTEDFGDKSKFKYERLRHDVVVKDENNPGIIKDIYSEIVVSERVLKRFGYTAEDFHEGRIPEKFLHIQGVRIPTEDKHSMANLKIVDIMSDSHGNAIMMPYELIKLSGADFDIDSLYARMQETYKNIINTEDNRAGDTRMFGDYIEANTVNKAKDLAWQEYINSTFKSNRELSEDYFRLVARDKELNSAQDIRKQATDRLKEIDNEDKSQLTKKELKQRGEETAIAVETSKTLANKIVELKRNLLKQVFESKDHNYTFDKEAWLKETPKVHNTTEISKYTNEEIIEHNYNLYDGLESQRFIEINPLTRGELNNYLLEIERKLSVNKGNREIANTPTSLELFKSLKSELEKEGLISKEDSYGLHDMLSKMKADEAISAGDANIGPSAIFNTLYTYLIKYSAKLEKVEEGKISPNYIMSSHEFNLSSLDENGEINSVNPQRVQDSIATILAAMTDNAKERLAAQFNLTTETLPVALVMIGLGNNFDSVMLLIKNPIIQAISDKSFATRKTVKSEQDYKDIVGSKKSDLEDNVLKEFGLTDVSPFEGVLTKQVLLDVLKSNNTKELQDIKPLDENSTEEEKTNYNKLVEDRKQEEEKNKEESSKKSEKDKQVQKRIVQEYFKGKQVSDILLQLSTVLQLIKGLKSAFVESEQFINALDKLGYGIDWKNEDIIKTSNKGNDIIEDLDRILSDKFVRRNIKTALGIINISSKAFILQTNQGRNMLADVSELFKENKSGLKDFQNNARRNLLAYYAVQAYRNSDEGKNLSSDDNISKFLLTDIEEKGDKTRNLNWLQSDYLEILKHTRESGKNNEFLDFIAIDNTDYTKAQSMFYGYTVHKFIANIRSLKDPDKIQGLISGFNDLYFATETDTGSKEIADKMNALARNMFKYLIIKDSMLFQNQSFIKLIDPILFQEVSDNLDKVQELFNKENPSNSNYKEVFGKTRFAMESDFAKKFGMHSTNYFDLKSAKKINLLANQKSAIERALASQEEDKSKEALTVEDTIVEDDNIEDEGKIAPTSKTLPIFWNNDKGQLYFNIFANSLGNGVDKKSIFLNKNIIANSKLVKEIKQVQENGVTYTKIGFPLTTYLSESNNSRTLLKLTKFTTTMEAGTIKMTLTLTPEGEIRAMDNKTFKLFYDNYISVKKDIIGQNIFNLDLSKVSERSRKLLSELADKLKEESFKNGNFFVASQAQYDKHVIMGSKEVSSLTDTYENQMALVKEKPSDKKAETKKAIIKKNTPLTDEEKKDFLVKQIIASKRSTITEEQLRSVALDRLIKYYESLKLNLPENFEKDNFCGI